MKNKNKTSKQKIVAEKIQVVIVLLQEVTERRKKKHVIYSSVCRNIIKVFLLCLLCNGKKKAVKNIIK